MLLPSWQVTFLKLGCHLLDAETFGGEQDEEVVEHVGTFIDHAFVGAVAGFDDQLEGFFAHFLRHTVEAVAEEAGRI